MTEDLVQVQRFLQQHLWRVPDFAENKHWVNALFQLVTLQVDQCQAQGHQQVLKTYHPIIVLLPEQRSHKTVPEDQALVYFELVQKETAKPLNAKYTQSVHCLGFARQFLDKPEIYLPQ